MGRTLGLLVAVLAGVLSLGQAIYPPGYVPYYADCSTRSLPQGHICHDGSAVRVGGPTATLTLPDGGGGSGGPHTHAGPDVNTGTMAAARLGSGTAGAGNFLRGDQTWTAATGPTLDALELLDGSAGLLEQTGADTFTKRALGVAASTSVPTRADGDGRYVLQATYTALDVLTKMLTVDGPGSGLDADTLDGTSSAGFAAASHAHAASDVTSGTVATARLGSGTANSTTFLRGDQTWATPAGGSDPWTNVILGADFNNSTTTVNPVTGLSFTPAANTRYLMECFLFLRAAAITTGARPGLNFPSGLTESMGFMETFQSATAGIQRAYGASLSNTSAASTAVLNTTESWPGTCYAYIITGASPSGDVQITLASEVAASQATVRAGSFLRYRTIQ